MRDAQESGEAVIFYSATHVGRRFTSGSHMLDEARITRFASEFDP
jgi:hypothetical protein